MAPNDNNGAEEVIPEAVEEGGDQQFELDKDGKQVLDENGKPKPIAPKEPKRPAETPEAKRSRLTRELDQHNKKHPLTVEPKPADKKGELDYGAKAFLMQNDIKTEAEMALVQAALKENPSMTLESLLTNGYFKAQLKELRDEKAAEDATPRGNGRGSQNGRDSVEYWIAEGKLPPDTPENRELRAKIVNAKMKQSQGGSVFSSHPVQGRA